MRVGVALAGVLLSLAGASAQVPTCQPTPSFGRCELVFEMNAAERQQHANPFVSVQLQAEFRSPKHRTLLLPGFYDGEGRMIIRFAPTGEGDWEYRITSNIARWNGGVGKLTATPSENPGFIEPANGHHWRWTGTRLEHLWMGDTMYRAGSINDASFRKIADARGAQKFTHLRAMAISGESFPKPDQPDYGWYRKLDERVEYLNSKGICFDAILGADEDDLARRFAENDQLRRYVRYMVARYSAFHVTWQLTQEWEEYRDGRALLKRMGTQIKELDPYGHPRTTHAVTTSAPLLSDGWMDHVVYQSSDDHLGAIEHQLYAVPKVNAEFGYENSGAGASHAHHVASDEFRRRLWNSFMNGQYPTFGNTGTYGGAKVPLDLKHLDSPGARAMTVWFDFVAKTRYWELEPYFDLDGGRAMALPDTEYIVYIEKPTGPIEVRLIKHGYDVKWLNPANGETVTGKEFKSEKFVGEAPTNDHDWVLHISREGRKEGMLRSYKFESRPFLIQEPESAASKVPFKIAQPETEEVSQSAPPKYEARIEKQTRGTRRMYFLWTGEMPVDGRGYRVLGTGAQGTWRIPPNIATTWPAVMNVRLFGLNANGKLYFADRLYRVKQQ